MPTATKLGKETAAMPMRAETIDAIIGVDTHTDTHTASLVDPTGREHVHRAWCPAAGGFFFIHSGL